MRIAISHTTRYRFDSPASHGLQRLRLTPRTCAVQTVRDWRMVVDGARVEAEYEDHNQNLTTLISFGAGAQEIEVSSTGLVETLDTAGVVGKHTGFMPLWAFLNQTELTRPGPLLRKLAGRFAGAPFASQSSSQSSGQYSSQSSSQSSGPGEAPIPQLHALSDAVLEAVAYETGRTDASTSAEAALAAGHGVCQDHAHIFIGAARLLGVPARYVSGYLLMDGVIDQQAGHAWAEAHVAGLGWVGFDVSNAICPDARYVRVAAGADYHDAAPITGVTLGSGAAEMTVEVSVAQQSQAQ